MGLPKLRVFGDSKTIIDWVNDEALLEVLALDHWCSRIKDLITRFHKFICSHIFREHNRVADRLSKEALELEDGYLTIQQFLENEKCHEHTLSVSF